MPNGIVAIILLTLMLISHFGITLYIRVHGGEVDALAAFREIEEELEKGKIPSGSITEANFIMPEGFPIDLAKRLWLFLAQLVSEGCSKDEIRRAIIDANDTLKLPVRVSYELKNYTIVPRYDKVRVHQSSDGCVSVEIPYKVINGHGKEIDADSIRYESNGTNLFHVLYRYPKRRTYLVRAIDPNAYILTFIDLETGEVFNKTARINIGLFSNVSQNYFGFESFIVAVPGHFEETRETVESQVREFRVLLPAHDPLVVDTSISPTTVKIGDVITVSARIRNPQEAKNFKVLLGIKISDKDAFEAWVSPPGIISGYSGQPIYLHLRPKRAGVYQATIYLGVVEPENLDVVFWNGEKAVTYVVTVLPEAPRLKVEFEAEILAKFVNLSITLVNTGGQEAENVRLFITGDVEEKELEVGKVWHTWRGNMITRLLSPIARLNVTVVYYDIEGKRYATTALATVSTTNFVTPKEWRTYLIEVPGYEETKRVFVPGYRGATHLRLYLMRIDSAPPGVVNCFNGLSLIPISPKGFTLTIENANNTSKIASEVPEARYMLIDVKPGFLCERVLREDEVKKLFHIGEDEKLEPDKIPDGYEVKLVKEEVLNQSEIVTVDDSFYEYLKYNGWEDSYYKYEDMEVKKWNLNKATTKVSHGKMMEFVYRPLLCQGDLIKGILIKNYAARDMAYELEAFCGPVAEFPPKNSFLNIPAYGSVPLNIIQLESVNFPILIRLKYQGRVVAFLWVHATGKVSGFWRGFWDGMKEKLPGIIVTATIMVVLAIPTGGGSLLSYVKDLVASAAIPTLMAVGVASNIREIFEAYSAYKKMGEVAEALDGFSQKAAYAGYLNAYSFFQGLKNKIKEGQGLIVGSTALDLLADVTVGDVFIAFGREDAPEYEKGKAIGRLVGVAASIITYVTTYYRFLSDGPRLLSWGGKIKAFLKGVYNWITPPLWDVGVIARRLTVKGIAASLAFSEESDDFKQRLNEIKDDEGSLSSLVEFTGRYLDDALDVSRKLGLSENAFLGLLWAYGKCKLSEETWSKFIQEMEGIGRKSKKCANELLHRIYDAEGSEVKHVILDVIPKLAESSPEELEGLGKLLALGVGIEKIETALEKPGGLKELLSGIKEFDFGKELIKITLTKGEQIRLHMGKGHELNPGAYWAEISWKYGEEKSGKMVFWTVKGETKMPEGAHEVYMPRDQVDKVLDAVGKDEAKVYITEAKFYNYRSFFPTKLFDGMVELNLYDNEAKIGGISYKFTVIGQFVRGGELYINAEFEGKNIEGNKLMLVFCSDSKLEIKFGGASPLSVKGLELDIGKSLMKIAYLYGNELKPTEYSFNFKPLSEQIGCHLYEELLQVDQRYLRLNKELFEILGYDAREELKGSIGSKYGILVGFDNKEKSYTAACTASGGFEVHVPLGASKVEWIWIARIEDKIPYLLHEIIKAEGSGKLSSVEPQIGEAGARIVVEEYKENGVTKVSYKKEILSKLLEKFGISPDKLEEFEGKVEFEFTGKQFENDVDGKIIAKEDIVIDNKVVFKKGDVIAVIEVKSSVKGEVLLEDLCKKAMGEKGLMRYVAVYGNTYGIAVGYSYDAKGILAGEPGEIKIEVVKMGELKK